MNLIDIKLIICLILIQKQSNFILQLGLMGMSAFVALNKWLMSFWLVFHEFWY